MKPSSVTDLLFQNLSYRGDKQKVIASNIANLNTPEYKTKDLTFDNHLQKIKKSDELMLNVTHKNHIAFDMEQKTSSKPQMVEVKGLEEQNDGNNVNLDQQMSEMSKNAVMYDAITNSIKKDSRWFKMMVDASSKN
jgi:flagellar basal-body rod protein FlgB